MDRVVVNRSIRLSEAELRGAERIGRNARGFWLAVCLGISTVAGWLMFYFDLLQ